MDAHRNEGGTVATKQIRETRTERKRRENRASLLEAAFRVMTQVGVADAKIKDITDEADLGFGTFYNYFADKDDLTSQVLDCMIDDLGRRNVDATKDLRLGDPALVIPISTRLVMREAFRTPIFNWWVQRPGVLYDRMRVGFGPFAKRDIREAIDRGIISLDYDKVDPVWDLSTWIMIGGIREIILRQSPSSRETFIVESMLKIMGMDASEASRVSNSALPTYPEPAINWEFRIEESTGH